MNTRFEIKSHHFELQIDNSHLYLNLNDDKTSVKIALKDIVTFIEYLLSRIKTMKNLTK